MISDRQQSCRFFFFQEYGMFKYILRITAGLVFVISAIAKFLSIDSFEIYLFSLGILPLGLSFIAARLIIAVEAVLGLWFVLNLNNKATEILTYCILALFSGFLTGQILAGSQENCHCFGDFVDLSPIQSLIKNIILVLLIIFSSGKPLFSPKKQKLLTVATSVAAIAAVFIISPPDNFRYESYKSDDMVNENFLREKVAEGVISPEIFQGEKIVCFFSVKCEFCSMSAKKLAILRRLGDFSRGEVISYFGKGETTTMSDAESFIESAGLDCYNIHFIQPDIFLKITNGAYPLILLIEDGRIVGKYSYRDLH